MRKLHDRPVNLRMKVVESIGETHHWRSNHEIEMQSSAVLNLIEKSLVTSLEDMGECEGMGGSRNDKSYSDPRICDMAGTLLAERWPDRYTFDISQSEKKRDHQRIESQNRWRLANNLPAIPFPPDRQLERLGRGDSTKITVVEWLSDSLKPEPSFALRIDRLKNKRLDPIEVIAILTQFVRKPEPGSSGIRIVINKDSDLTGVQLSFALLGGFAPTQAQSWDVTQSFHGGSELNSNSFGSGSLDNYASPEGWEDLNNALKKLLAGTPETPFKFKVRIAPSK